MSCRLAWTLNLGTGSYRIAKEKKEEETFLDLITTMLIIIVTLMEIIIVLMQLTEIDAMYKCRWRGASLAYQAQILFFSFALQDIVNKARICLLRLFVILWNNTNAFVGSLYSYFSQWLTALWYPVGGLQTTFCREATGIKWLWETWWVQQRSMKLYQDLMSCGLDRRHEAGGSYTLSSSQGAQLDTGAKNIISRHYDRF